MKNSDNTPLDSNYITVCLESASIEQLETFSKQLITAINKLLKNQPLAALCFAGAIKSFYHDIQLENNDYLVRLFPESIPSGEIRSCIEIICKELHPFDTSDELKEICTLHALNSLVDLYKCPPSTFTALEGKHKMAYLEYFNLFYCEMRATLQRINRLPRKEKKDEINSRLMEIAGDLGDYLLMKEHDCLLDNLMKPEGYVYKEGEHETDYLNEKIQDKFIDNYDDLMEKLSVLLGFDYGEEDGVRK